MQVGLHSEPQNIWLDAGTRQPDISSLHHEPVAPQSLRWGNKPEVGGHYAGVMFSSLSIVRPILSSLAYMKIYSITTFSIEFGYRLAWEKNEFYGFYLSHRPNK